MYGLTFQFPFDAARCAKAAPDFFLEKPQVLAM